MYPYLDATPTQKMNLIRDKAMDTNFNKMLAITSKVTEWTGFSSASRCAKRMVDGERFLERVLTVLNIDDCSKIRHRLKEKQVELKPLFEKLLLVLTEFNSRYEENKNADEKIKLEYEGDYKRLCNYENLKRNLTNTKYLKVVSCLNKYVPRYIEEDLLHFKLFMSIENADDPLIKKSNEKVNAIFETLKKNCNYKEKHLGFLLNTPIDCRLPSTPEALDFQIIN